MFAIVVIVLIILIYIADCYERVHPSASFYASKYVGAGEREQKTFLVSAGVNKLDCAELRKIFSRARELTIEEAQKSKYADFVWVSTIGDHMTTFDQRTYQVSSFLKNLLAERKNIITRKDLLYAAFTSCVPESRKYFAESWDLFVPTLETAQDRAKDTKSTKTKKERPAKLKSSPTRPALKLSAVVARRGFALDEKNPVVLRPVGGRIAAGWGVEFVSDWARLGELTKKYALEKDVERVLISRYITDPQLWRGRKFHLRCYLLVHPPPSPEVAAKLAALPANEGRAPGLICKIFDRAKILTAKLPYIARDWGNHNIHDSHGHTTDGNFFFPEDYEGDADKIRAHFRELEREFREVLACDFRALGNSIANQTGELLRHYYDAKWLYTEQKAGFEVFGIDIIIRQDYSCVLLECNEKVGYNSFAPALPQAFPQIPGPDPKYNEFCADYFRWVNREILSAYGPLIGI